LHPQEKGKKKFFSAREKGRRRKWLRPRSEALLPLPRGGRPPLLPLPLLPLVVVALPRIIAARNWRRTRACFFVFFVFLSLSLSVFQQLPPSKSSESGCYATKSRFSLSYFIYTHTHTISLSLSLFLQCRRAHPGVLYASSR